MATATSNLRAAVAARAGRVARLGLLTGTVATPGPELSAAPYARQPAVWPTDDTDGEWTSDAARIQVARTAEPTLIGGYTTAGELVEWELIPTDAQNPLPRGVDYIDTRLTLRETTS